MLKMWASLRCSRQWGRSASVIYSPILIVFDPLVAACPRLQHLVDGPRSLLFLDLGDWGSEEIGYSTTVRHNLCDANGAAKIAGVLYRPDLGCRVERAEAYNSEPSRWKGCQLPAKAPLALSPTFCRFESSNFRLRFFRPPQHPVARVPLSL